MAQASNDTSEPLRKRTFNLEEATQFMLDSDISDGDSSDFTDSGSDLEPDDIVKEIQDDRQPLIADDEPVGADEDLAEEIFDPIFQKPPRQQQVPVLLHNIFADWSDLPNENYFSQQEFTGISGVDPSVLDNNPLYLFELFFSDELLNEIVTQTNLYADQYINSHVLKQRSRMKKWSPVTKDELMIYFGIILYRGVVWKPTYEHYYTENAIFSTPMIRKVLRFERFLLIEKFLHFVDNSTLEEGYTKTMKILPVHNYLSKQFTKFYTPEQNVSIDESLLLWKGRLSWPDKEQYSAVN